MLETLLLRAMRDAAAVPSSLKHTRARVEAFESENTHCEDGLKDTVVSDASRAARAQVRLVLAAADCP